MNVLTVFDFACETKQIGKQKEKLELMCYSVENAFIMQCCGAVGEKAVPPHVLFPSLL